MSKRKKRAVIYGILAEFEKPEQLLRAAEKAYAEGYRSLDGFSPMPVEGLAEAIGFKRTRLPRLVLAAGMTGMLFGFWMQWYATVISYPLNVAGKPLNSWPAYIPITFELTILAAGIAATLGMLAMNGLPTPHHPLFNVPRFALATRSRFFLVIKAKDPKFDLIHTRRFMESLGAYGVYQVDV